MTALRIVLEKSYFQFVSNILSRQSAALFSSKIQGLRGVTSTRLFAQEVPTSPLSPSNKIRELTFGFSRTRLQAATMSGKAAPSQSSNAELSVTHDDKKKEFVITLDQDRALLQYTEEADGSVDLWHTEVPPVFRGKGVAKVLAKSALDHFSQKSTPMKLSCTYLQKYAKDFPEPAHDKFIRPN